MPFQEYLIAKTPNFFRCAFDEHSIGVVVFVVFNNAQCKFIQRVEGEFSWRSIELSGNVDFTSGEIDVFDGLKKLKEGSFGCISDDWSLARIEGNLSDIGDVGGVEDVVFVEYFIPVEYGFGRENGGVVDVGEALILEVILKTIGRRVLFQRQRLSFY